MSPEEYSWVCKAIHSDSEAYGLLLHRYQNYLYKVAYTHLNNMDLSLEIVQETVYQGFLGIKKLKNPDLFLTWITRILLNKINDYYKNEYRTTSLDEYVTNIDYDESLATRIDISRAISRLKLNYQKIIILKYYQDLSINEISKILNMSEGTVKCYLFRARELLKKELKEDYFYD